MFWENHFGYEKTKKGKGEDVVTIMEERDGGDLGVDHSSRDSEMPLGLALI